MGAYDRLKPYQFKAGEPSHCPSGGRSPQSDEFYAMARLRSPESMDRIYEMSKHINDDSPTIRALALKACCYIVDRGYGKAKESIEIDSRNFNVSAASQVPFAALVPEMVSILRESGYVVVDRSALSAIEEASPTSRTEGGRIHEPSAPEKRISELPTGEARHSDEGPVSPGPSPSPPPPNGAKHDPFYGITDPVDQQTFLEWKARRSRRD